MEVKTRNGAREFFKKAGLSYSDLNRAKLQNLRRLINHQMVKSGLMEGTYRCKQRPSIQINELGWAGFLRCKSFYFDDREAVSFNRDGFIGFAGWSDDKNIKPILKGFEHWVNSIRFKSEQASQ